MKIFTKDSVYVQISDINYLVNTLGILAPSIVLQTVYGTSDGLMIIDNSMGNTFVKFTDEEVIKFFKDDNIILDYDEVKGKDEKGIRVLLDEITSESKDILLEAKDCLFSDDEDKLEEMSKKADSFNLALDRIGHRQKSLYAYINYLKGKSKMVLPEEVLEETKKSKKKVKSNRFFQLLSGKKKDRQS